MNHSTLFRRTMSMVLCIIMVLSLVAMPISAEENTTPEETLGEIASVSTLSEGEAAPLSDAKEETIYVVAGSDYQTGDSRENELSATLKTARKINVEAISRRLAENGIDVYGALFCGDYTQHGQYYLDDDGTPASKTKDLESIQKGISQLSWYAKNIMGAEEEHIIFVQGNHDRIATPGGAEGVSASGAHDTDHYGVWVLNNDDYGWFGGLAKKNRNMAGDRNKLNTAMGKLRAYLEDKVSHNYTKPIFVAAHTPLHYSHRTRQNKDAQYGSIVAEVLNEYGKKGLNIIYLYGHNHSEPHDNYIGGGAVHLDWGDTMYVSDPNNNTKCNPVTLSFTYMNAGYFGTIRNTNSGGNVQSMAVFEITGDTVRIMRYSAEGMTPVRAKGALYTDKETAKTYGLSDAEMSAYMNRSYKTVTVQPFNDNGNMGVRVEQPNYRTAYYQTDTFLENQRYLIGNEGSTTGNIQLLYRPGTHVAEITGTIQQNSRGYFIEIDPDVAVQYEWQWGKSSSSENGQIATLGNTNGKERYMQMQESGKDGLKLSSGKSLRTTSDPAAATKDKAYWGYDSTIRTKGAFKGEPGGLYAHAPGQFNVKDDRYYVMYYDGSWTARGSDGPNGDTAPAYIYSKHNDHYDPSESSWIWAEGKSEYHLVTGQIGSWTKLKTLIQSELRVVKETNGEQTVISTYTLRGTADPTTIGTYTLYVDYNGQTLATITVDVVDAAETFLPGQSTVDPNFGSVYQGADEGTDTGATVTLRFENGAEVEVPVLVGMLKDEAGNRVNTLELGTYENLQVWYREQQIPGTFTLYVTDKNYPVYPNVGSVKVDKTATGIDFQNTGAAQVELSATGIPKIGGMDVIVMVDTSSSMTNLDSTGVNRLERTHNAVNQLIDTLKTSVTDGKIADVKIAIADFNSYTKAADGDDYKTEPWGYYALDGNCYSHTPEGDQTHLHYETNQWQYTHGTRTGTDDPMDMGAKAFIDVMQLNNNGLKWANNNTLPVQSGTNYDFAFDAIYQLGYNIKQRNKENGLTNRELVVVFMSDGVPFQFNYYMSHSRDFTWNDWLNGSFDKDDPSKFTGTSSWNPFKHFYNKDGKHWMAEAIKGDPNKDYTVIRKSKTGLEDAFKSFNETAGSNQYFGTLPGLGATMYTIGLALGDPADETLTKENQIYKKTIVNLMKRLASDESKALTAVTQDELDKAFHSFVGDMVNAASDAYYLDTMGKDYDLYTSNAFKKSDKTTVAGKIPTIQAIEYGLENGSRTGKTNVFEEITFGDAALNAAEGTEVSVTIQYKEKLTDTAFKTSTTQSFKMGEVLKGYRVWYNTSKTETQTITDTVNNITVELPPETFYYYIGALSQDKEYALSYPVYLTDALDDNDDNDAVPAGIYPTNKSATLHYINYLGNPSRKDTVSPRLPWESAQVSYAFYLVDENGKIIRNQETGALTTDFANRVAITNPVVFQTIDLNTSGQGIMSNIAAGSVLPTGYELFVEKGVDYSVTVNSGDGGGSWTITSEDTENTTYVTGIGGNAYSNETTSSTKDYDYSNTTVWFAVVAKIGCVPDTVVVDFGLPVTIDVMSNDLMIGTNGILKGIGKDLPANVKPTDGSNQKLEAGFGDTLAKNEDDLKYGDAAVSNGKVVYTLKTMEMDAQETFYYGLQYTGSVGAKGYYYGKVNVIPATIIYFEDNFLEYNAFEMEDNDQVDDEVVWSTGWTTENEEMKASQSQDRPGEYSLPELDANNIYGYDPSYAVMKNYSMGSAPYATVTKDYYATAEFDFWGTGFDVLSVCYYNTGTVMVSVYDKDEYYAMEGNTADKTAALTPVAIQMVDTFYGYSYNEETKEWMPITEKDKMPAATYQIPVIKMENLPYGNYTAVITVSYLSIFDHYEKDTGYRFFVDAIRIYDPANDGEGKKDVQDAYVADGEGWPSYYELRNLIIDANSFSALSGNTYSNGIVFIDGNKALNDDNASGKDPTGKSPAISDYTNFGPNNEVYLAKNQGVSFTLPADSNIAGVHIALKKIYGTTTSAEVRIFGATDNYNTVEPLSVNTTTDLYYDISHLLGDTIVIYNDTSSVVSITNIKITHTQAPAEGEDRSSNRFKVSKQGTAMMLAALESTLPEIQEPEVTPTAPATVVNKWNIVLGDDIGANFYVEAPKANAAMAAVKVTVAGHTEIYDLYAMTPDADGLYKIPVNVAAAQMTEDITLQMVVDGEAYTAVSYTVQDYAKTILAGDYSAATKNLVQHMLSYGAAAQSYFGVNKDNLANAGNEIAYTAQYPAEYPQLAVTGKVSGIRFYGASLVFESKVAVRYYFEAESVEGVAFSVNGVSYPAVEKNGKFYVEVPGIAPSAYADSVVLSVQKDGQQLQVSYSPLTYMVRMSQKGQPELQALMNAMYGYYEAAIAYEQQAD